jgi:hypothetical protein
VMRKELDTQVSHSTLYVVTCILFLLDAFSLVMHLPAAFYSSTC